MVEEPATGGVHEHPVALHLHQPRQHQIAERLPILKEIAGLHGIVLQVVELRTRGRDQFVASLTKRAQIAPSKMMQRINGLGVGLETELALRSRHQRSYALAIDRRVGWLRDAEKVEHGRHHIDRSHRIGHAARVHVRKRRGNDERHGLTII